jgi:type III secretion protein D
MDAGALAGAVPIPPPPPPNAQDQARVMLGRGTEAARSFFTGWRLVALAGAILLLVGITMGSTAIDAFGLRPSEPVRVARALDGAGLPDLQVTADPTGGVFVTGIVGNQAARARAQETLTSTGIPGIVDVRTTQELASASADVARLRGLEVTARPKGRTGVELHTTPLSPDARDALVQAIRSDVSGVGQVAIVDDLAPVDNAPVRTVADATKRVSTVIAGDPAYIRTVDGARYFPGAILPSGHRLAGIKDQTVVLEKNGRETRITF